MALPGNNKVVSYFYDQELGNYSYGGGNPMRPHRARLVYSLLKSYGLTSRMSINGPAESQPASFEELTEFHADDYIDFLRSVTPNTAEDHLNQLKRFNMGQIGDVDCPVFDGVYEYCQIYAGASVTGAANLADGKADVAFNWSGGMHHAKKAEASGFCYVNDIVLGILELLKVFPRVLYVDIDIHHGDGVEEAFYLTDRVMTVSFHKYGEFFPGTGALQDIGYAKGKYYCVNVPLKDGMDDDNYCMMYEPIMAKVMEMYQPGAIVMCCGADSLSGDKLGCFNLSMEGHSNCIEFLARYNVPLMVLGGGGYTLRNVARCWCYETGRLMGVDLPDELPVGALHEYNYYLDTGSLRISTSNMKNMNTREELEKIKREVLENLAQLPPVPSAQMSYQPAAHKPAGLPEEDPDVKGGGQAHEDARRVKPGDESDEEEDAPHGARTDVSHRDTPTPAPAGAAADGPAAAAAASAAAPGAAVKADPGTAAGEVKQEPMEVDAAAPAAGGIKPEPETADASAMAPATLATSQALNGPGAGHASAAPAPLPAALQQTSVPQPAGASVPGPAPLPAAGAGAPQGQPAGAGGPPQPSSTMGAWYPSAGGAPAAALAHGSLPAAGGGGSAGGAPAAGAGGQGSPTGAPPPGPA